MSHNFFPSPSQLFPRRCLEPDSMATEIARSFERSRQYGISRAERNKNQQHLSAGALEKRCRGNSLLLDAFDHFAALFYRLLPPEEFMFGLADADGYILRLHGAGPLLEILTERNCIPGYRWLEQDVGTSALGICLERKIPIQVHDTDHYCRRAHGFTSSAAPILSNQGELLGVLVTSAKASHVHPHTLVMLMNAAGAIENELQLVRMAARLEREAAFLQNTIDGISTGVMLVNGDMDVIYVNKAGRNLLTPLGQGAGQGDSLGNLVRMGMQREALGFFKRGPQKEGCEILFSGKKKIRIVATIKSISTEKTMLTGYLVTFEAAHKTRLNAERISGTQAYFTFDSIVGVSPVMQQAISLAKVAAAPPLPVLLVGETGTGKELFAQAIHNASPRRRKYPFVPVNCAAIPAELLESELFGYAPGAFTGALASGKPGKFELADGGTVFLDEIGDMPLPMQAKLLRVLQTQEVYRLGASKPVPFSVKIISASHIDLHQRVRDKFFREDLYYRLGVFPVSLPALRERGAEDILALCEFIFARMDRPYALTAETKKLLTRHKWPGNVRELENVLQRAVCFAHDGVVTPKMLDLAEKGLTRVRFTGGTLADVERKAVEDALAEADGNVTKAAKRLGITRVTFYRKLRGQEGGRFAH